MLKLKFILKKILLNLPYGFRLNQIIRSILLLRERSFRDLFFEVKREDICLDLGANIGDASLVMWLKGVSFIYALEPNIEIFNILNNNLRGIRNFKALNIAISSESSIQKLYLHKSIIDKSRKSLFITSTLLLNFLFKFSLKFLSFSTKIIFLGFFKINFSVKLPDPGPFSNIVEFLFILPRFVILFITLLSTKKF